VGKVGKLQSHRQKETGLVPQNLSIPKKKKKADKGGGHPAIVNKEWDTDTAKGVGAKKRAVLGPGVACFGLITMVHGGAEQNNRALKKSPGTKTRHRCKGKDGSPEEILGDQKSGYNDPRGGKFSLWNGWGAKT